MIYLESFKVKILLCNICTIFLETKTQFIQQEIWIGEPYLSMKKLLRITHFCWFKSYLAVSMSSKVVEKGSSQSIPCLCVNYKQVDKLQKSILPLCWLTFRFPSPIRSCLYAVHCYNARLSCPTLGSNFDLAIFITNQHSWKPAITNNYLREIKVKWLLQPTFKTSIQQKTIIR